MIKKVIGLVVVVVLVVGAAFWWFVIRPEPEPELTLDGGGDTAQTTTGTVPETLDGTWVVVEGDETTAGFRIDESFGGAVDHTAVGRSDVVSGTIEVAGSEISAADFTVDLTAIEFSDDPPGLSVANRANAMRNRGLQTSTFPESSFELTEPIDLGGVPAENETITASVTGNLTLHGVTNEVTFEVEAKLVGDTIRVVTKDPVPIVLADYDIEKPTGGPVASIADEGSFEFLLVLSPQA